ncbi:MAG: hypothetical protein ACOCVF_02320 [bacterium]
MKRKLQILILLFFCTMSTSFTPLQKDRISGTWEMYFSKDKKLKNLVSLSESNMSLKLNFFRDGTGFIEVKVGHIIEYDPFTWEVDGKYMYIDYRTIINDKFRLKRNYMYRKTSKTNYNILVKKY